MGWGGVGWGGMGYGRVRMGLDGRVGMGGVG